MKNFLTLMALAIYITTTGCTPIGGGKRTDDSAGYEPVEPAQTYSSPQKEIPVKTQKSTNNSWGYQDDDGPGNWGDLNPDYYLCKEGSRQSPIDITETITANLKPIKFKYKSSPYNIHNTGKTVKVNMRKGSSLVYDGKVYGLNELHFHLPSEHLIDGKPASMEVHFVHKARDGKIAVVAVLMDSCFEGKTISSIWKRIPKKGKKKKISPKVGKWIKVKNLIPDNKSYYQYNGSLTTPPCTEDVTWIVMRNSTPVSRDQVKTFSDMFSNNARPVQNKNHRTVRTTR